jgi:DNA polymerase
MQLATLDFETYYDQDFTLSKLTVEEYVRDARFKAHMIGYKIGESEAGMLAGPIEENLKHPSWNKMALICHNAQFDGFILNERFNIRPAFWCDTLSMARLIFPHEKSHSLAKLADRLQLGRKNSDALEMSSKGVRDLNEEQIRQLGGYCKNDVELTYQLFKRMIPLVPKEELRLIDLTIRMFTEPCVRLDTNLLATHHNDLVNQKTALLESIGATREDLHSAESYAGLLRKLGIEPPTKISPATGKETYAFAKTDAEHAALLEDENPRVAALVAARLGIKSTGDETRTERLYHTGIRGLAPVPLKYCGAHTTRWSGDGKVNWQNFRRGSDIRKSVCAPEGYSIIVGDMAQIECRMLNWLAGEDWVLEAFRSGADLYSKNASSIYGRPINKKDNPIERFIGKTNELGCGYGMGGPKFLATVRTESRKYGLPVHMELHEAEAAVAVYRETHPKVKGLWDHARKLIIPTLVQKTDFEWGPMKIMGGYIYLPNGAPLDYTTVSRGEKEFTQLRKGVPHKIYGGLLVENVVQALSRVALAQAMLTIAGKYRIVTCTHDEVVALARASEAEEALDFVLATLRKPPVWAPDIPLDAEGTYGERYDK